MLVIVSVAVGFSIAEFMTRDYRKRYWIEAELRSMGAYYVQFNNSNAPSWVSFAAPVGLERLKDYQSFDTLDFAGAKMNDDAIRGLSNLKHVEMLDLGDCGLTDNQLGVLSNIGSISILRLNGAPVTDDAILAVASIRGLKSIDISDTLVTSAGKAELQKRRPEIVIRHESR